MASQSVDQINFNCTIDTNVECKKSRTEIVWSKLSKAKTKTGSSIFRAAKMYREFRVDRATDTNSNRFCITVLSFEISQGM